MAQHGSTRFIHERLCKIQGLLGTSKRLSTVFKDRKLKKNTDLHV